MARAPGWPAPLLALALLAGCASGGSARSPWSAASEHEALERRLRALERQATHDRLELERLQRRVAELEAGAAPRTAGSPNPPAAPRPAEPPRPASPVGTPVAEPFPAPSLPESARPAVEAIEESELEESAADPSPAAASYEQGLRLLRDGAPEAAERELLAFAAAEPGSDLADNAWFWVGESRLARGDARGALEAYREAIDRYPEGNKIPDALFKLGAALAASDDPEGARDAWEELVRRFPDTAAAERARDRLAAP